VYDSHNSLFITGCFLWKDTNSNTGNGQFRSRKGAFTLIHVLISILFPADTVKDLDLGMLYAMRLTIPNIFYSACLQSSFSCDSLY
jgi:hypothetical protein